MKKDDVNLSWIAVNTKICPFCHKPVERSMGCNFMKCICGNAFCYYCAQPWANTHKDHYACTFYPPDVSVKKIIEDSQRL